MTSGLSREVTFYAYLTKLNIESGIQENIIMDFTDIDSLIGEEQNVNAECERCHHNNQSKDLHPEANFHIIKAFACMLYFKNHHFLEILSM